MAMFYKNSQGNIINLDNVREIIKNVRTSGIHQIALSTYDIKPEEYKIFERFEDSKTLDRFMDWLWECIEKRVGTEAPYCSYEEFASLQVVSSEQER